MNLIDAKRLLEFIRSEAEERMSAFKTDDSPLTKAEDTGFIEGLEVVTLYVQRVTEDKAA